MYIRQHSFGMQPDAHGFSHGLKKCPPDTFLPSLRSGRPFESLSAKKIQIPEWVSGFFGTPKGTRTPDLLIRSQSLYPTELSARNALLNAQI